MPRPPRRITGDSIYHVLNRGNAKRTIFRKPQDFEAFLAVLSETLARFDVELLCWCLMGNHWHLVLRPRTGTALPRFMQWLTLTHVRRYHEHHERSSRRSSSGHLYQGRYKHFRVEEDSYFLTLCRYIEANALRAGLVRRAQDWRWSSLHQRIARSKTPAMHDWPVDRPSNWTELVNEILPERESTRIRESIRRERPLGSVEWVARVAKDAGLEQSLRPRGRPPKPTDLLSPRQQRRRQKAKSGQNGT